MSNPKYLGKGYFFSTESDISIESKVEDPLNDKLKPLDERKLSS
jgi:hypothetical protein